MQSTNEELETSKEELQSLNEELHTVNLRLSEKVDELGEANSDLRNLFDSTEIATIFIDRNLIIRGFTPAITALYNLIPSDIGRPLTDISSRLDYAGVRNDVARVLDTQQPLERRVMRQDRSTNYVMRILPYRESDSRVSGALVTFIDVTSIVQAENSLREADLRKDIFLATLSHELRNPLAPIRTAARLLDSTHLSAEDLMRLQAIISRQVGHMSSLLDDLLDVSRITRGAFALHKDFADVQALIEAAVEAIQPALEAKDHTLRLEHVSPRVIIEVDPVRITQVITNLINNAIKYTPPGGTITVGTRRAFHELELFVRDTGIGLAPETTTWIFDMFTRVSSDAAPSDRGLGIGLALTRGLVELHGGRIEARSGGLGTGSEFTVTLPAPEVHAPDRPREPAETSNGVARRVLIVDDNHDGADSLRMFLDFAGHDVHVADNGDQALGIAASVRPDVAVIDIGMPGMNGYEVARRIRAESWGSQVQLIALTGWGQFNDKQAAASAGFDHHVTKPADPSELMKLFTKPNGAAR